MEVDGYKIYWAKWARKWMGCTPCQTTAAQGTNLGEEIKDGWKTNCNSPTEVAETMLGHRMPHAVPRHRMSFVDEALCRKSILRFCPSRNLDLERCDWSSRTWSQKKMPSYHHLAASIIEHFRCCEHPMPYAMDSIAFIPLLISSQALPIPSPSHLCTPIPGFSQSSPDCWGRGSGSLKSTPTS